MTTIFENSNHYKVVVLSAPEMKKWHHPTTCDKCESHDMSTVFYVAARNLFLCPKCYEKWCATASEKRPELIEEEEKYLSLAIILLNVGTYFAVKSNN